MYSIRNVCMKGQVKSLSGSVPTTVFNSQNFQYCSYVQWQIHCSIYWKNVVEFGYTITWSFTCVRSTHKVQKN